MCTRATYLGPSDTVITTRSMDWAVPMPTTIWVLPAGQQRDGAAGPGSLQWTSRYGSVVTTAYGGATVDGVNEHGLVANVLYLTESDYGHVSADDPRPLLSVAGWGQYPLDNFRTVAEAVAALREEPFRIAPTESPDGHAGTVHLALSDPSGDSAIFEYINGELRIHHGREHQVMTNSPIYDQQLALNAYWQEIGGTVMLPGTSRAADRFARASFYLQAIPQTDNTTEALASAFGVIRNASVPLGISTPGQPNISSTRWRTVTDHKNCVYFFESALSPYLIWLDLNRLDFAPGAPVLALTLDGDSALVVDGGYVSGEASSWLQPATPFAFLPAS